MRTKPNRASQPTSVPCPSSEQRHKKHYGHNDQQTAPPQRKQTKWRALSEPEIVEPHTRNMVRNGRQIPQFIGADRPFTNAAKTENRSVIQPESSQCDALHDGQLNVLGGWTSLRRPYTSLIACNGTSPHVREPVAAFLTPKPGEWSVVNDFKNTASRTSSLEVLLDRGQDAIEFEAGEAAILGYAFEDLMFGVGEQFAGGYAVAIDIRCH